MPLVHTVLVAVALSAGDQILLLDFYADWCGPCRAMQPAVQALVQEGYPVRKINVDREPALAAQYGVKGIPCYILLVNGREVDRVVGGTTYSRLQRMFKTAMAQAGASHMPAGGQPSSSTAEFQNTMVGPAGAPPNRISGSQQSTAAGRAVAPAPALMSGMAGSSTAPGLSTGLPIRPVADDGPGLPEQEDDVLLQATVRIRVKDPHGESRGSGTIVDARGDAALILTCGHIFRESRGKGQIEVDLFGPGLQQTVSGICLGYDEHRDLGLVMIRPRGTVPTARIAPAGYRVGQGEPVITAGCSHGQPPTLIPSRITSVNRYNGPPNLQVAGQPVQGRSGGGLFTRDGLLIGVCNAADPQDREGFFAALGSIHAMLDAHNLAFVYQAAESAVVAQGGSADRDAKNKTSQPARAGGSVELLAERTGGPDGVGVVNEQACGAPYRPGSTGPRLPGDPPFRFASVSSGSRLLGAMSGMASADSAAAGLANALSASGVSASTVSTSSDATRAGTSIARATGGFPPGAGQGNTQWPGISQPSGAELAALGAVRSALNEGGEVILIVRSRRDPQARSQVITIDNPSPEFLRQLASEASTPPPGRELTSLQVRP